jgi:hypothetical protein
MISPKNARDVFSFDSKCGSSSAHFHDKENQESGKNSLLQDKPSSGRFSLAGSTRGRDEPSATDLLRQSWLQTNPQNQLKRFHGSFVEKKVPELDSGSLPPASLKVGSFRALKTMASLVFFPIPEAIDETEGTGGGRPGEYSVSASCHVHPTEKGVARIRAEVMAGGEIWACQRCIDCGSNDSRGLHREPSMLGSRASLRINQLEPVVKEIAPPLTPQYSKPKASRNIKSRIEEAKAVMDRLQSVQKDLESRLRSSRGNLCEHKKRIFGLFEKAFKEADIRLEESFDRAVSMVLGFTKKVSFCLKEFEDPKGSTVRTDLLFSAEMQRLAGLTITLAACDLQSPTLQQIQLMVTPLTKDTCFSFKESVTNQKIHNFRHRTSEFAFQKLLYKEPQVIPKRNSFLNSARDNRRSEIDLKLQIGKHGLPESWVLPPTPTSITSIIRCTEEPISSFVA